MDLLTPQQMAELDAQGACPYWQHMNPTGWCVEKWWAGGVAARLLDGVAVVAGMTVLGFIIAEASNIGVFRDALGRVIKAKNEVNFLTNPRAGRRRRRRR